MYRIFKLDGTDLGLTDSVQYIRYGNSGCFTPATPEEAIGVAVNGVPYNLLGHDEIPEADTVVVATVNGGAMLHEQRNLVDELIISALEV